MADLVFWMGIILLCGVFVWTMVVDIMRRDERGEQPFTLSMAVKIFLLVCGVICLSIGQNNFAPKNTDAGGDEEQTTVTKKEVRELEKKRVEKRVKEKQKERDVMKADDDNILNDMKSFKDRLEGR